MSRLNCKKKGNSVQKQRRKNAWVKLNITEYLTTCIILLSYYYVHSHLRAKGGTSSNNLQNNNFQHQGSRLASHHAQKLLLRKHVLYGFFAFREHKCGFLL